MTQTAELIPLPERKKRAKSRIEIVVPTMIVDVWRLVEKSIRDGKQPYPDTSEDDPEFIRSHLFSYLQLPFFMGSIAKIGKRPVGVVLGDLRSRVYGRPQKYMYIHCLWIEPTFRNQGIGRILWGEYTERMKRHGIHHWESCASPELTKYLQKEGFQVNPYMSVIGGRVA